MITAQEIKAIREGLGWSQIQLAAELGIGSQLTIIRWENGKNSPLPIFETKLRELEQQVRTSAKTR